MGHSDIRYGRRWIIALVSIVVVLVLPVPKTLVHEWSVRVIDQSGLSVSGIRVSESWESYTFGLSGGTSLYTTSEGRVVFPRQKRYWSIGYWMIKAAANIVGFGVHAGFGSIGRVWISDPRPKEVTGATCSDSNCSIRAIESELRVVWR
jgi:hypothetical protein